MEESTAQDYSFLSQASTMVDDLMTIANDVDWPSVPADDLAQVLLELKEGASRFEEIGDYIAVQLCRALPPDERGQVYDKQTTSTGGEVVVSSHKKRKAKWDNEELRRVIQALAVDTPPGIVADYWDPRTCEKGHGDLSEQPEAVRVMALSLKAWTTPPSKAPSKTGLASIGIDPNQFALPDTGHYEYEPHVRLVTPDQVGFAQHARQQRRRQDSARSEIAGTILEGMSQ